MIRMKRLREAKGLSKQQLSYIAQVPASTIGWIESGRFTPYEPQLRRCAVALGFVDDPQALLDEVDDDHA